MRYICVQPRTNFFGWQLQVMIDNFLKIGINHSDMDILIAINDRDLGTMSQEVIDQFNKLENRFPEVKFYYYQDTRWPETDYSPSVYFNIMKQHFAAFPNLKSEVIFCHDCDILFTKKLDIKPFEDDHIWYLSDTVSYIWSDYLLQKDYKCGEALRVLCTMCGIVGVDSNTIIKNKINSGGAQYIIKNVTSGFWDKVEKDSITLYNYLSSIEDQYIKKHEGDHPIQKWTAGMWSFLWNGWLFGHEIKVDKRLDFCWATDLIEQWDKVSIYHNAGIVCEQEGYFYKNAYSEKNPYNSLQQIKSKMSNKYAGYKYVEALEQSK